MRSSLANSVIEWLRAIGVRTGAFTVANVDLPPQPHPRTARSPGGLMIGLAPTGGGRPIRLAVEAQERISPLLAVGILQRMAKSPRKGIPTLCSRVISERVAELCRSQGVSYLDEGGNCRLSGPGFFVQVEGRSPVRSATALHVDPFATKSGRIARVLLASPKRGWQVQELADEAQVSLGLVAKVKRVLLQQAFVEERERRVHLRDPKGLLDAWAAAYEYRGERVPLYVMQKPGEAERSIARWCADHSVRAALTDLAGTWRLAPTVRYHQTTVYVEAKEDAGLVNDLLQHLGAKRVDSGTNLVLLVPEDPFVFYQSRKVDGIGIASPVQLYLDLRKQPGRGEEAALEILQREIVPTW